ncbi:unnamed protein product, partial [marine sediment metagenome]
MCVNGISISRVFIKGDAALISTIIPTHNVILNGASAQVSPSTVVNFVTSQVAFIPIILFIVITLAAQLVATAMAAEKENKTLETLLASPISRKSIVAAKLMGAGLISLLIAATYMFGMNSMMNSLG